MGQTKIEWTATYHPDGTITPGYSFNPWIGCQKNGPGCQNCYAERDFTRKPRWANTWGPPATSERLRTSETNWRKPLAWNKKAQKEGVRHKVFCASLADVFEDHDALIDWRLDLFELIRDTPHLDWLMPTKRPRFAHQFFKLRPDLLFPNIVPGTSIEDQKTADARVPWLLQIPAAVRFVSAEPLLELLRLWPWLPIHSGPMPDNDDDFPEFTDIIWRREYTRPDLEDNLHWLIAGCESGPHRRPAELDWFRSLRDQCVAADVPFFLKQMDVGGKLEKMPELDGRIWNQMPEVA